jgi:hypothetical protein
MSNSLAIAAVTATLRNLLHAGLALETDLADVVVTMQPLDRARPNGTSGNQVNIFLYHVQPSGAWRNADFPGRTRSGETAFSPLGLNLYYLLTAFGRDNDTQRPFSHQLIGRAMSILNDHPLLGSDEVKTALPDNDLWTQVERIRFTLQPYSVDEIAKLWTGFQTQYRLSVAYEAAVVLIDSTRPAKTPLPVLVRGPGDSGVVARGSVDPPFPLLNQITPPRGQVTVRLGDRLTISGANLGGDSVRVLFTNLIGRIAPIEVTPDAASTDQQIVVQFPSKPAETPAGVYSVSVTVTQKGESSTSTNELIVGVAPQITSTLPLKARRTRGVATVKLMCAPEVLPGQRVALLLGDQEMGAMPVDTQTGQLTFAIPNAVPGTYFVRLRVDGVDSQIVDRSATPPAFDTTQQVTIS